MRFLDFLTSEATRFWAAIVVGMGIGLAGAYGRELNDGRAVSTGWFRNRLLIYPFLGLAAGVASESFHFSRTMTAFAAAMLALLSFDAVRIIAARFVKKVEGSVDQIGGFLEASHGDTIITLPAGSGAPQQIAVRQALTGDPRTAGVRSAYAPISQNDPAMEVLIHKLDELPDSDGGT